MEVKKQILLYHKRSKLLMGHILKQITGCFVVWLHYVKQYFFPCCRPIIAAACFKKT
jgi:hypothetical protein